MRYVIFQVLFFQSMSFLIVSQNIFNFDEIRFINLFSLMGRVLLFHLRNFCLTQKSEKILCFALEILVLSATFRSVIH